MDTHIKRLRAKMDEFPIPLEISTIWGVGYKFEERTRATEMNSKITRRLIVTFTTIFILFGAVVLILYTSLFQQYIKEYHEKELLRQAEFISQQFTYTLDELSGIRPVTEEIRVDAYKRHMRNRQSNTLENLWLISKDGPAIVMDRPLPNFSPEKTSEILKEPLEDIFSGRNFISDSFSQFLNTPTISVGVPITSNGEIVGAAIFHSPISNLPPTLQKGKEMLLISLLASTIFAAAVIAYSARRFTNPIRKMHQVALQLAEGDYHVKTNVSQNDEIGQLARSMDQLSEQLEKSSQESAKLEKMRQDFIVNISHELRTPVTVMRGSLEALRDGVIPDEVIPYYYDTLCNVSVHLQRLVNDLLELSRLQNVDFDIKKEPLNLVDVLEEVRRSMEHVAQEKQIQIHLQKDVPRYLMEGDYVRLRQMFINIMDNAIKFSPEKGNIYLHIWEEDDQIKVSVKDEGQGMDSEQLDHIFDRFYKQDENNPSGVGLGLSIVHAIARHHNFTMDVQAKEGYGTEFIFSQKKVEMKPIEESR